jgi:hypothetical protein
MVLYRRRNAGWEYWEAWTERSGHLLVHRGRAGERGVAEHVPVSVLGADERLSALVRHQLRLGFRTPDLCELGLVLVQWPGERACSHLHGRAGAWMHDVLGWTGLGSYVGFDGSAGLTIMGESIDPELAVEVLSAELDASGLPAAALIAVCAGKDVIHWPPARRGEPYDAP